MKLFAPASSWIYTIAVLLVLAVPSVRAQEALVFEPGTFQGVIRSDSNNDESFGFITLTLTRSGTFTMKFNLGVNALGRHYYVKTGQFDANGQWAFEGPVPDREPNYAIPRIINLQLSPVQNPELITGGITDLTHTSTVEMERVAVHSNLNPSPATGYYTFWLGNQGEAGLPTGTGYGSVSVARTGRAVVSGRTADNRPFVHVSTVTIGNRIPVFTKMGPRMGGILAGWLAFRDQAESDLDGQLTWLGPEVPGPNNAFVNLYTGEVPVVGSRYVFVPRTQVLSTTSSENNLGLTLSQGGLETAIDRTLTLLPNNRVLFNPRMRGDALALNPATGIFTGTFLHANGYVNVFRGAILQKQNRGMGFFVDRTLEPGQVTLQPF